MSCSSDPRPDGDAYRCDDRTMSSSPYEVPAGFLFIQLGPKREQEHKLVMSLKNTFSVSLVMGIEITVAYRVYLGHQTC